MSEPLAERLSRFTPDCAGLNRDALLFAAGRASVRPNRRWQLLAGMLAACQLLTLAGLWTRTPPARIDQPTEAVQRSEPAPLPIPHDPSELGVLSERLLASEGDWVPPADDGPMIASQPPLRVFDSLPAKFLN
jgi:hypothetical protein